MRLQLLAPWWAIILYGGIAAVLVGWQLWKLRHAGKRKLLITARRGLLLLLVLAMALGPSVPGGTSSPGTANLDVLFAVDTTPSMGAQDYDGTQLRLDGVKRDMLALAAKMPGAHLEIITFDTQSNVVLPFTADASAFSSAVEGINRQISSYSEGSAIDKPINLITQELKNSRAVHPERSRLLFYMGDGEQTATTPVKPFTAIAPYVNGGAVLGYGTAKGAQMVKYTGSTTSTSKPSYITTIDPTTNKTVPAISKMDETALKLIASQLKVSYQNRDSGGPITSTYQASKAQYIINHSSHVSRYINLYWLLAIPLAGLIFLEWWTVVIKTLELRGGKKKAPHA